MPLVYTRGAIWPYGRESVAAISKEEFLATHAQLVQASRARQASVAGPGCIRCTPAALEAGRLLARALRDGHPCFAHLLARSPLLQVLAVVVPECVPAFRQPLEAALG